MEIAGTDLELIHRNMDDIISGVEIQIDKTFLTDTMTVQLSTGTTITTKFDKTSNSMQTRVTNPTKAMVKDSLRLSGVKTE